MEAVLVFPLYSPNSYVQKKERSTGPVYLSESRGKLERRKLWWLTLRMFVTVGSARRINPGLGWMLAFSDDFSSGSRSAALWP
jgi:hypothetical protein